MANLGLGVLIKLVLIEEKKCTLMELNFAGTKFRGSKNPRNFCDFAVLNFALAEVTLVSRELNFAVEKK